MAIHRSKSPKAFQKNIQREERLGKPEKQAVAIAFGEADWAKQRDAAKRRVDHLKQRKR